MKNIINPIFLVLCILIGILSGFVITNKYCIEMNPFGYNGFQAFYVMMTSTILGYIGYVVGVTFCFCFRDE